MFAYEISMMFIELISFWQNPFHLEHEKKNIQMPVFKSTSQLKEIRNQFVNVKLEPRRQKAVIFKLESMKTFLWKDSFLFYSAIPARSWVHLPA